jgi:hypothetical protein
MSKQFKDWVESCNKSHRIDSGLLSTLLHLAGAGEEIEDFDAKIAHDGMVGGLLRKIEAREYATLHQQFYFDRYCADADSKRRKSLKRAKRRKK